MNIQELKLYILEHVDGIVDLDIKLFDDGEFYVEVEYTSSRCGALFSKNGRMYSMARLAFDEHESELMQQVQNTIRNFLFN